MTTNREKPCILSFNSPTNLKLSFAFGCGSISNGSLIVKSVHTLSNSKGKFLKTKH